ncbi:MAG TPA: hypothetical protein VKA70_02710 [Blastocatellia bacterium]|nr:hypothetical protein [Blastocatellia bacterium]
MRKHFARPVIGLAVCCLMLALAVPALSSYQGRYKGRAYTKDDVDRIIKRVEERSDEFKKMFDNSLDRSVLDGTKTEDRLNERVKEFESELDELRKEFDRKDSWRETRSNVEEVLRDAEGVNTVMKNRSLPARVEASWIVLRGELNKLAGIYNLPRLKV